MQNLETILFPLAIDGKWCMVIADQYAIPNKISRQYFHHTQAKNKWVTALIQSVSLNYLNQILTQTDDNCCCYKDHSCDVLDAIARDTDSCNVFYKN